MSAEIEIDTTAAFPPGAGLGAEWRKSLGHISSSDSETWESRSDWPASQTLVDALNLMCAKLGELQYLRVPYRNLVVLGNNVAVTDLEVKYLSEQQRYYSLL